MNNSVIIVIIVLLLFILYNLNSKKENYSDDEITITNPGLSKNFILNLRWTKNDQPHPFIRIYYDNLSDYDTSRTALEDLFFEYKYFQYNDETYQIIPTPTNNKSQSFSSTSIIFSVVKHDEDASTWNDQKDWKTGKYNIDSLTFYKKNPVSIWSPSLPLIDISDVTLTPQEQQQELPEIDIDAQIDWSDASINSAIDAIDDTITFMENVEYVDPDKTIYIKKIDGKEITMKYGKKYKGEWRVGEGSECENNNDCKLCDAAGCTCCNGRCVGNNNKSYNWCDIGNQEKKCRGIVGGKYNDVDGMGQLIKKVVVEHIIGDGPYSYSTLEQEATEFTGKDDEKGWGDQIIYDNISQDGKDLCGMNGIGIHPINGILYYNDGENISIVGEGKQCKLNTDCIDCTNCVCCNGRCVSYDNEEYNWCQSAGTEHCRKIKSGGFNVMQRWDNVEWDNRNEDDTLGCAALVGEKCYVDSDCANSNSNVHVPGVKCCYPNGSPGICQEKVKDWAGYYYCPNEANR